MRIRSLPTECERQPLKKKEEKKIKKKGKNNRGRGPFVEVASKMVREAFRALVVCVFCFFFLFSFFLFFFPPSLFSASCLWNGKLTVSCPY
jgi:hypothetical protein